MNIYCLETNIKEYKNIIFINLFFKFYILRLCVKKKWLLIDETNTNYDIFFNIVLQFIFSILYKNIENENKKILEADFYFSLSLH